MPTTLDFKDFNYDSCSLIECISWAYEQNKTFTKHTIEAMMKALEEKLELEVSIPRKLYDEWEPTIKVKLKIMSAMLYVIWVLAFPQFQNLYVMC